MFRYKKIHIIGVCGTLTGNCAVFLKEKGYEVRGSDKAFYEPMAGLLKNNDIFTYNGFDAANLDWNPDLVVIGNAVSRGNAEVEKVLNEKLNYISVPELIKYEFIENRDSVVVSGTHGKTSTTTIISEIFEDASYYPSYIIGGIPSGKESGFKAGKGKHVILEGDEYDTAFFDKRSKFLHYKPKYLLINNIEFDHSDIYNSIEEIELTFKRVINIVPGNGKIIANFDDKRVACLCQKSFCEVESYGQNSSCDWLIKDIEQDSEFTSFSINYKGSEYRLKVKRCGLYQIYNFTAAFILAKLNGIDTSVISKTLLNFSGVKRRFDIRGEFNKALVVEDFAHHPTAIANVIKEVKDRFSGKKLTAVFEPRSNTTRRNIFFNELLNAFSFADEVIIGKIDRIELLDESDRLDINNLIKSLNDNKVSAVHEPDTDTIIDILKKSASEDRVFLIMSNGSFDNIFKKMGF